MSVTTVRQLFIITIILLLPEWAISQLPTQKTIDSLLIEVSRAKEDTNKVKLLSRVSQSYYPIDDKKGTAFGEQALKLSQKLGWKKGIEKAYHSLGSNYWAKYDFIRAQDYYGGSLKIAEEIDDKLYIAMDIHDIGICYEEQGNFSKAIEYYKRSISYFAAAGEKRGVMGSYSNIADIYMKQSKYGDAVKYYLQSLKVAKQEKRERDIGYYYQQIGTVYSLSGDYQNALTYEEEALHIFQKLKDYEDLALNLDRLGSFYLLTGNYSKAVLLSQNALKILSRLTGPPTGKMEADFYASIGKTYFAWSKNSGKRALLQLAAVNFQKSAGVAQSINYRETVVTSLKALADVQTSQGYFATALETYKAYVVNRDSLSNSEKDKAYTSHELAFEYAKRRDSLSYASKLEKQELERVKLLSANKIKQRSLYAIVITVIMLFSISYFFFRGRLQQIRFKSLLAKEKSEIQLNQMVFENKLNDLTLASLKSQMNPHFIFNCLNSIKFYVEKNDTEAASLYITKFSKLIRNILDSARSEKITLAAEIELIELYLDMEQMRLKDKLHYQLNIDKNIDIDFVEIPPLLIQPYVENAIWHGLMHKEKGGNIDIKIGADEKYLVINVADDGIGREKAAEIKNKNKFRHTSHGSTLTNERISIFNAKYKTNTEVSITDLKNSASLACGTLVTIKLLMQ